MRNQQLITASGQVRQLELPMPAGIQRNEAGLGGAQYVNGSSRNNRPRGIADYAAQAIRRGGLAKGEQRQKRDNACRDAERPAKSGFFQSHGMGMAVVACDA